ncbi:ATP-binding cassette domain-containing protein [Dactylosporangium sp. CS-047395]|uniref:ATP-binding cassette domain-containing protein n=1 Tax=Dactylosporangium sp. CS-047395 TaxID=3239936 RepID=UPI003D8FC09C
MIRTRGLTKDFATGRKTKVHAVRGISLDIEPGELVAVLGPNGAGKTTTMRMLTTLIQPTAGTAVVAGHDVVEEPERVRRRIGYVGQGNGAAHTQRVGDELRVQGRIYGLDRREAKRRADELLEALDLAELGERKVTDLSGGQQRRLDVAIGLVHAPELLFLDEPSTGLDPQNRANLWSHIARMRAELGMTIVLTTHYLDEADSMAERVVVVDHGEVIADDSPNQLKAKLAGDRLLATGDGPALAAIAAELPGARDLEVRPDGIELRVSDGPAALPELITAAAGSVRTAEVRRPTLDDVFLALTGRNLRDA